MDAAQIKRWLSSIGLNYDKYWTGFDSAGYDRWDILFQVSEEAFVKNANVKPGHATRIHQLLREIKLGHQQIKKAEETKVTQTIITAAKTRESIISSTESFIEIGQNVSRFLKHLPMQNLVACNPTSLSMLPFSKEQKQWLRHFVGTSEDYKSIAYKFNQKYNTQKSSKAINKQLSLLTTQASYESYSSDENESDSNSISDNNSDSYYDSDSESTGSSISSNSSSVSNECTTGRVIITAKKSSKPRVFKKYSEPEVIWLTKYLSSKLTTKKVTALFNVEFDSNRTLRAIGQKMLKIRNERMEDEKSSIESESDIYDDGGDEKKNESIDSCIIIDDSEEESIKKYNSCIVYNYAEQCGSNGAVDSVLHSRKRIRSDVSWTTNTAGNVENALVLPLLAPPVKQRKIEKNDNLH